MMVHAVTTMMSVPAATTPHTRGLFPVPTHRLSLKDAAELWSVSIDTVRRRLRRGDITGEFVDGRWLVDVNEPPEAQGLQGVSQLALRLLSEEVERLRAENDRLLGIIELMSANHPDRRTILERLRP